MASIGHLATGALIGAVYARATGAKPLPAMAGFAALALAPDLDLLTMNHVASDSALDHRAMTHALVPSLVFGGVVAAAFGRSGRRLAAVLGILAWASHGVLDAFTRHGPGPMLLWPFEMTRYAFGWQPVPGAPSYQIYFSRDAVPILGGEALLFLPVMLLTWLVLGGKFDKTTGVPAHRGDTGEMATSESS